MWLLQYSWVTSLGTRVVDRVPLAAEGFSAKGRRLAAAEALLKLNNAPGLRPYALSLDYRVAYEGSAADFMAQLKKLS
jgi:hypothetical protein